MRREEFEHVIAAAAEVSGEREIVVIGSQAILGSVPDPPATMLFSIEADVYPLRAPDKAVQIDGSLGDGSQFHSTYGYYAHGVGPETAVAPAGWEDRLVRVEIPLRVGQASGVVALCLEVHDLVLAKCVAGRERDREFCREALAARLVEVEELLRRIDDLPEPPADRTQIRKMLEGMVGRGT
ncbi:MAG TPA: DUF6036 family nucleotidyltransferase [Solirubrobacterales bacterium]|nr:DUF6036 family nucleotidyltransferase [Solirubrobacterales bacterium]